MSADPVNPASNSISRADMTQITSYAESVEILRSPHFYSPLHYRSSYPVVGGNLLALFGPAHVERRRLELPVVARAALRRYEFGTTLPIFRENLTVPAGQASRSIDLLDVLTPAVISVAASVIGLDDVDTPAAVGDLSQLGSRISAGVTAEWLLVPVEEAISDALGARQEFIDRFYRSSKSRRARLVAACRDRAIPESDLPNDIITLFLRSQAEPDDELLVRECLFWLTASTDTTIHSSAHAVMEIYTWLGEHPEDRMLFNDLSFLQRAVGEAIRLHPPLPSALRCALTDVALSSGRHIRKGEYLDLDLNRIDRDTDFFGMDAARFNPHRHDSIAGHVSGASFGHGVHSCLGRRLAIGAGTGRIESEDAPVGVAVRLLEILLAADAELDPSNPPVLRTRSTNGRWECFPITIRSCEVTST